MSLQYGLALILLFWISLESRSQTLSGRILEGNDTPLPGALIQIEPIGRTLISNLAGEFGPIHVPSDVQLHVKISFLGNAPIDTIVFPPIPERMVFRMKENSLELNEITITGKENQSGLGTSTEINRQAIAHVQPNSLRDVLQLLPGQLAINPSVNSPQQILIRQAPVSSAGNTLAQMGTALVMDGSPVSNDGNLQYDVSILNSSPGASPPFQSVSGQGTDLRQVPADQIERVEVIRGIASVRYGNATSGTILVETRMGAFDPQLRVRANPQTFQVGAGAGFSLMPDKQSLSLDLDYIDSKPDPRDVLNGYSRITANLGHEIKGLFGQNLTWRSRLGLSSNVAVKREDQGNDPAARAWTAQEQAFRFNNRITYAPNYTWLDEIEGTFSMDYNVQEAFYQEFITTNVGPRPTFTKDTTGAVPYGTARYLNETNVNGKALSYYHRIEATGHHQVGRQTHRIMAGTEWRHDSNHGEGRTFDLIRPPRQNFNAGDRPRTFDDTPALNQFGVYVEDKFSSRLLNRPLFLQAGLRLDHYFLSQKTSQSLDVHLQPRLNVLWSIKPEKFSVKGGLGILSRVPPLIYLTPGPRFIDIINFNYFASNPLERLLIVTTRRIDLPDGTVRPFKSYKSEIGVEGQLSGVGFSITGFRETTRDGPGYIREPYLAHSARFDVLETPTDLPPVLGPTPSSYDTLFLAYDRPVSNQFLRNTGIEYTVEFPEIKGLNTQVHLTGAFIHTSSKSIGDQVDAGFIFRHINSAYIPVYRGGVGSQSTQWNSSFRLIHRIPSAGLIVSSLFQVIWIQSDQPVGYSEWPIALIDRKGVHFPISEETATQPENEKYHRGITPEQLLAENRPPLILINLRLNKEFAPGRGFAFYVNNLPNHRPLYQSARSHLYSQRNIPLFFGAEIFYQLKSSKKP